MRLPALLLTATALTSGTAAAQAPAWSDLWRVAEGAMTRPAALAEDPTGVFWNPAGVLAGRGPSGAMALYQTPDVVNVTALLVAATMGFGEQLGVGVLAGRASVSDLIRTTSSPIQDGPDIPVYAQFAGAAVGGRLGPLDAGATALLHDARLDATEDGGLTLDVGMHLRPLPGLVVGVASHLGDPLLTDGAAAQLNAGVEYGFGVPALLGLPAELQLRYGLTARDAAGTEHLGSAGLLLARQLRIDFGALWASGYGSGAWEPVLGIAFGAGPFRVGVSRGSGTSGIGATYRITLGWSGAR